MTLFVKQRQQQATSANTPCWLLSIGFAMSDELVTEPLRAFQIISRVSLLTSPSTVKEAFRVSGRTPSILHPYCFAERLR